PWLTQQPVGGARAVGDRITLAVRAGGYRPLTFQWYKNDIEIPCATSSSITLSNLTPADSGNFRVQVSNPAGTTSSDVAVLTVAPDPAPDTRNGLFSYWPMDTIDVDEFGVNSTPDLYSGNH